MRQSLEQLYDMLMPFDSSKCLKLLLDSCMYVRVCAAPAHGRGEEGSLYEAESWAAIGAFLFGPDPSRAITPHPAATQNLEKKKKGIKVYQLLMTLL